MHVLTCRFHRPVKGEEGYDPEVLNSNKDLSSLAQIVGRLPSLLRETVADPLKPQTAAPTKPFTQYTDPPPPGLTPSHLSFLKDYLAPSYLSTATLEKLSGQFVEASEIVLHNFLHPTLAESIKAETKALDNKDYPSSTPEIPPQDLGEGDGWSIQGPTSKHRYATLSSPSSTPALSNILTNLLPSPAFRAWLSVVSSLAPVGYRAEARRFRKGLDYTLANGEEKDGEVRLDVVLGTTWWADVEAGSEEEDSLVDNGGWECYLAAPDEGEDPAVYQSQSQRTKGTGAEAEPEREALAEAKRKADPEKDDQSTAQSGAEKKDGPSISMNGQELEFDPDQFSPSDFDSDSEAGSDDGEGPLLTLPVSFNKLLLVLRDPGVMRFVKYLGNGAGGSRWDVGGEWEVGVMEEDEEEEEEEK
jgi:hypothetical protein